MRRCLTSEYFIILPSPYYSFVPSFSHAFWIDAFSVDTIKEGLQGICNLPEAQSCALNGSPESALLWINSLGANYALVFDNADNLTPEELEQYFPPGLRGNILITSRNPGLRHLTSDENSLEVKEMGENDAISLLLKAACLNEAQEDLQAEAAKIVNELFCIPLAIDQAGAFIAYGDTDITDYLEVYSEYRESLLDYPAFKGASKYNRSVYGTWELSFQEIQRRAESGVAKRAEAAKSAMFLLGMFAFFHFDGIIEQIFSYAATQKHEEYGQRSALPLASFIIDRTLLQLRNTGKWDNFIFKEGVRELLSFSLIKLVSSKGIYGMHPLIHAWGRDRITSAEDRQKYYLMAYVMLACSLSEDFNEQPYQFRRILVTHLRANIQHRVMAKKEVVDRYFDDAHEKFGRLLMEQGYNSEAEKFQIQVWHARSRTLGKEHSLTISAMNNLALTYESLGKCLDAEKLQIQVLDLTKRHFGEEHQNTISAMGNLASTYKSLGNFIGAERLQIKVLDFRTRLLGKENPDTIIAMGNLAVTYKCLGKFADAEKLQSTVLDVRSRLLGEEHPDTIIAMNNIALTYKTVSKFADAEKLQIKVLDMRNRILGEEHPDTINAMSNLAITYKWLEKYADAEKLQIKVLDQRKRLLGEEHPNTIGAMSNLANTYERLGKYADAEKLGMQVLEMRNRLLGEKHPDTMMAMSNLAATYGSLGKYVNAAELQLQVLDMRKRILGQEHPHTIQTMEGLAISFFHLQRYNDAVRLQAQVVNAKKKIFGDENQQTVNAEALLAAFKSQANPNISGTE